MPDPLEAEVHKTSCARRVNFIQLGHLYLVQVLFFVSYLFTSVTPSNPNYKHKKKNI